MLFSLAQKFVLNGVEVMYHPDKRHAKGGDCDAWFDMQEYRTARLNGLSHTEALEEAADEQALLWVKMHAAGITYQRIAAIHGGGLSRQQVLRIIEKINNCERLFGGE